MQWQLPLGATSHLEGSWGDRPSLGGLWPQITQSTDCTLRVSHGPLSTQCSQLILPVGSKAPASVTMGSNPIHGGPRNLVSLCSTPRSPRGTLSSHDPQRTSSFPMTRGPSLTRLLRSQRYGTEAGKGGQLAWQQMPSTVPQKRDLKTAVHLSPQPETNVSSGVNRGLQMAHPKCTESQSGTLFPGMCPQDRPQATDLAAKQPIAWQFCHRRGLS